MQILLVLTLLAATAWGQTVVLLDCMPGVDTVVVEKDEKCEIGEPKILLCMNEKEKHCLDSDFCKKWEDFKLPEGDFDLCRRNLQATSPAVTSEPSAAASLPTTVVMTYRATATEASNAILSYTITNPSPNGRFYYAIVPTGVVLTSADVQAGTNAAAGCAGSMAQVAGSAAQSTSGTFTTAACPMFGSSSYNVYIVTDTDSQGTGLSSPQFISIVKDALEEGETTCEGLFQNACDPAEACTFVIEEGEGECINAAEAQELEIECENSMDETSCSSVSGCIWYAGEEPECVENEPENEYGYFPSGVTAGTISSGTTGGTTTSNTGTASTSTGTQVQPITSEMECEDVGLTEPACTAAAGCAWITEEGFEGECVADTGSLMELECEDVGFDSGTCTTMLGCVWDVAEGECVSAISLQNPAPTTSNPAPTADFALIALVMLVGCGAGASIGLLMTRKTPTPHEDILLEERII